MSGLVLTGPRTSCENHEDGGAALRDGVVVPCGTVQRGRLRSNSLRLSMNGEACFDLCDLCHSARTVPVPQGGLRSDRRSGPRRRESWCSVLHAEHKSDHLAAPEETLERLWFGKAAGPPTKETTAAHCIFHFSPVAAVCGNNHPECEVRNSLSDSSES